MAQHFGESFKFSIITERKYIIWRTAWSKKCFYCHLAWKGIFQIFLLNFSFCKWSLKKCWANCPKAVRDRVYCMCARYCSDCLYNFSSPRLLKIYTYPTSISVSGHWQIYPQSNQSAGLVSFLIFCTLSIFLLASPVAGRKPQWTAGAD
jgi:hypothetical protein